MVIRRESGRWEGRWGDEEGEWEMGRESGRWGGRMGDEEDSRQLHNPDVGSMQAPSDSTFFSPSPAPSFLPSLPPRIDDERLEVIGLYSFLHVGKIQVSLAEPLRVGQASEIKVQSFYYACGRGGGEAALCLWAWWGNLAPTMPTSTGQPLPPRPQAQGSLAPTMPTSTGQPRPHHTHKHRAASPCACG